MTGIFIKKKKKSKVGHETSTEGEHVKTGEDSYLKPRREAWNQPGQHFDLRLPASRTVGK